MLDFLKLKKEVSETTDDIEPEDVISVKGKLKDLGHYQEPEWGMTNFTDRGMFDGIRKFQKEKGLTVDGIMKPEGETEGTVNKVLSQRSQSLPTANNNRTPAVQANPTAIADRDKALRDRIYSVVKKHEDDYNHPYKDTKGYVTVGLGSNVDNQQKFNSVNWRDVYGNPISKEDAQKHYQKLKKMPTGNFVADTYKDTTPLRINDAESRRLFDEHINQDTQYLRRTFKDFDRFPPEMQDVLTDIKYNTGNVDADKWPNLHKAISERNLEGILNNVNRKDVAPSRNDWAKGELRKIRKLGY